MIRTRHLEKHYVGCNRKKTCAIRDVSLEIAAGRFAVLTGASGSGKTTLLALLGALSRPTSGAIVLGQKDLTNCSDVELARTRREIGFVFQSFSLLPGLSVWENVTYPLIPRGVPVRKRFDIAFTTLKRMGLSDRMESLPEELSGGEQQRVAVARAVAGGPRILLADEPTSNLDHSSAAQIIDVFQELHTAGVTLLVSTHSPDLINLATDTLELKEGRLV